MSTGLIVPGGPLPFGLTLIGLPLIGLIPFGLELPHCNAMHWTTPIWTKIFWVLIQLSHNICDIYDLVKISVNCRKHNISVKFVKSPCHTHKIIL